MNTLVIIRHGQSTWNLENRFTGWIDVPLSERGEQEARNAGVTLREADFIFDIAFVSFLQRAAQTLETVLAALSCDDLQVNRDWRLNERHYGALQGLNKRETAEHHGKEKVLEWRRSFSLRPPELADDHPSHPKNNSLYRGIQNLPSAESLSDTLNRVQQFWEELVAPLVLANRRVLIVAHGNSLRALAKLLENMTETEILNFNIPTGIPIVYQLDKQMAIIDRQFLADDTKLRAAIDEVVQQTSKN